MMENFKELTYLVSEFRVFSRGTSPKYKNSYKSTDLETALEMVTNGFEGIDFYGVTIPKELVFTFRERLVQNGFRPTDEKTHDGWLVRDLYKEGHKIICFHSREDHIYINTKEPYKRAVCGVLGDKDNTPLKTGDIVNFNGREAIVEKVVPLTVRVRGYNACVVTDSDVLLYVGA